MSQYYNTLEVKLMALADKNRRYLCIDTGETLRWKDDKLVLGIRKERELVVDKTTEQYTWSLIEEKKEEKKAGAVAFQDILEMPTRMCYVKHPIVKSLSDTSLLAPKYFKQRLYKTIHGEPQSIKQVMIILSWYLTPEKLAQVIKEGKWYQEEEDLR